MKVEFNEMKDDVKKAVATSLMFYDILKNKEIFYEEEIPYTNYDKQCFSLFLGILYTKNNASEFLKDFDITIDKIDEVFGDFNINRYKEDKKEKMSILKKTLPIFIDLVNIIVSNDEYTKDINVYTILESLYLEYKCNSVVLEDVYIKLGVLNKFDEILMHPSFQILSKKIELEEEKNFSYLEKRSSKAFKLVENNDCLMEIDDSFDFSVGRQKELKKLMVSMLMPNKSVMITGPSGVGKSSIVKAFAYKIKNEDVPPVFLNKKIVSLNVASLVGGCKYVGSFEEKVTKLLNSFDENIILFIDEVHTVIGAGRAMDNGSDLSNILKPYLDSGKIKVIGTTTDEEYEKYISRDSALKRRFEIVKVKEPDEKNLITICYNAIYYLEKEMEMSFIDNKESIILELIQATNKRSRVYDDVVNNPDLIISIIKKSFAYAKFYGKSKVEESDLIEALKNSDRIYSFSSEKAIRKVKTLKPVKRGNVIPFSKY